MKKPKHLSIIADEVLSQVESAERIKHAEVEALRAVVPKHRSEIAQLLHKMAEDLRAAPDDVTYEDLGQFLEGR